MIAPFFAWLGRRLFGLAAPAAGEVLNEAAREARDYVDKLREETAPVPMPYAAVRHRDAQIASAAHAFPVVIPPVCPASLPPSAPPPSPAPEPDSTDPGQPWHQATVLHAPLSQAVAHAVAHPVDYPPVSLPLTPRPVAPTRPLGRASSGPPPRMSPPPVLPPPPRDVPGVARPPRPSRRR
jgi:hypothetical protein